MAKQKTKINIFWHRRDLRLADNAGLYHALKGPHPVLPLFIFDTHILDQLENRHDARITFIHEQITALHTRLAEKGVSFLVKYGEPLAIWRDLLSTYTIGTVYTNRDYEVYAKERDTAVAELLAGHDIDFQTYKDHVIFEEPEVQKKAGGTYTVFTPYKRTWLQQLKTDRRTIATGEGGQQRISFYLQSYPTQKYADNYWSGGTSEVPTLATMGFEQADVDFPPDEVPTRRIRQYDKTRDFPGIEGTSRLGIHYRFGTVSIREKARKAQKLNDTYLNELIWRDFYAQILDTFPQVENNCFRPDYEAIEWRNNEDEFAAWCEGRTGYPLVDAGMRQLNSTGYMHNRVRMVVASFLTKHLLIDWRWGEAYFAEKLLDYELASNNGGWQWAAGCGTDAQPYFRIFNPTSQLAKFDKDHSYVKEWVPEYGTPDYPDPIVEHKMARERAIRVYKESLNRG